MKIKIILLLLISSVSYLSAQSGRVYRNYNVLDYNHVKTVFTNGGVIAHPVDKGPRGAWIYDVNGYIGDFELFVGCEIPYKINQNTIQYFHSVTYCLADRRPNAHEVDPVTGDFWGFEPKQFGSSNLAISNDPSSWPAAWSEWPFKTKGATEAYYEMDDNNDEEFNFSFNNSWGADFKPDSTHLNRNGMGLKIESRYRQFQNAGMEDILFLYHNLINEGTTHYRQALIGGLMGTYVGVTGLSGNHQEYDDDVCFFDIENSYTFMWDYPMNNSRNPFWIGKPGYAGVVLAQSPGNPYDGIDNDRDNATLVGSNAPYFSATDFDGHTIQAGEQIILIDDNYNRSTYTVPGYSDTVISCGRKFEIVPGVTFVQEGASGTSQADGIDNDFDGLIDESYDLHFDFSEAVLNNPFPINNSLGPTQYINYFNGQGITDSLIDENGINQDELGLTSFEYFLNAYVTGDLLTNDESLYDRLSPGNFDLPDSYNSGAMVQGEDGDYFYGSGTFPLLPDENKNIIQALVYGNSYKDFISKVKVLQNIKFGYSVLSHIHLLSPTQNIYITPFIDISWQSDYPQGEVIIEYTNNNGNTWNYLATTDVNDMTYVWDINNIADGILNKVRIRHSFDPFETDESELFTINSAMQTKPQVVFTEIPEYGQSVSGQIEIGWYAGDADGEVINVTLYYSTTYSETDTNWVFLQHLADSGSAFIDTKLIPNSEKALLSIRASNISGQGYDISHSFKVNNSYNSIPDTLFAHVQGQGSGSFEIHVVDSTEINGHHYQVTFNELDTPKTYSVYDKTIYQTVLTGCTQLDSSSEGPKFDGVRLLIQDYEKALIDNMNSYWSSSMVDLDFNIGIEDIDLDNDGNPDLFGYRHPYDYEIQFFDNVVDTSIGLYGAPQLQTYFKIINKTLNRKTDFIYIPLFLTPPYITLNRNDQIFLFEKDINGDYEFGWTIVFDSDLPDPVLPQSGDTLFVRTLKPFSSSDKFIFTTGGLLNSISDQTKSPVSFNLSQNYPNPFNSGTLIEFTIPANQRVKLIIYDVLGRKVRELINQECKKGRHKIFWDGYNDQSRNAASGIYFFVLNSGTRKMSKKMLLIR